MSSLSQPNQPGLTSPLKWTPQPTYCRSMNAPSLISRVGRMTALKSAWPHGCGMYQATVKSGDGDLNGLKKAAGATATASDPISPPPIVQPSVSGASADTDKAPAMPHPASGIV